MSKMFEELDRAQKQRTIEAASQRFRELARRMRRDNDDEEKLGEDTPIIVESPRRRGLLESLEVLRFIRRPQRLIPRDLMVEDREPGKSLDLTTDFMEQLGILRNSVESMFGMQRRRALLFTSAVSGEGTTTIASSFARFLRMQATQRVLLCELNARRPSFSTAFSVNGAGLTDYFATERELASLVQRTRDGDLDILHAGRKNPDLIQIHLKRVMPRLLAEAFDRYDTVVIDAPPVISSPETPPMCGLVDGVVMVVQAGKTKREVVQRALEAITVFDGNIVGVVLNRKKYYIPDFIYKRL